MTVRELIKALLALDTSIDQPVRVYAEHSEEPLSIEYVEDDNEAYPSIVLQATP